MNMYFFKQSKNHLIIAVSMMLVLAGCVKHDDYYKDVNGGDPNRKQIVKIVGASDISQIARDVNPLIDTFAVVDLRREPNNSTELNQSLTVKLVLKPSLIDSFNSQNGAGYVVLPDSAYTILGDLNSITFQPGEVVKEIKIRLDKSKLDLSSSYALGFAVSDAGTSGVINPTLATGLYGIGIKNPYEADYKTTGFVFHPSAPRPLDDVKHLYTLGSTTCEAPLADLYNSGYYFAFDVSASNTLINWTPLGAAPPAPASGFMTMDNPSATDYSAAAPDAPGVSPWLSSIYNNTYDPATKTFWMHYGYKVGGNGEATFTRQVYEKWVRL
ncbi:MAG: DUF1735 domain-containing protein [Flavisolibacter sp.]